MALMEVPFIYSILDLHLETRLWPPLIRTEEVIYEEEDKGLDYFCYALIFASFFLLLSY